MAHKIKEIKYSGFSESPSDYECTDGELAQSENLIQEDGELKPVVNGAVIVSDLPKSWCVLFIHETTKIRNYIIDTGEKVESDTDKETSRYETPTRYIWVDAKEPTLVEGDILDHTHNLQEWEHKTLHKVTAVGNTLMFLTDEGIEHFLWKQDKNDYKHLGNHIPDVEVQFALVGHPRLYSLDGYDKNNTEESKKSPKERRFTAYWDAVDKDKIWDELSETNQSKVTSYVMAMVNKFVADQSVKKGRFCFPFFVRYALRLYDGSLVNHSVPILMTPSTKQGVMVYWYNVLGRTKYDHGELDMMLVAADLERRILWDEEAKALAEEWKDIVKSIDVFVSKPIYPYDQSGKVTRFSKDDENEDVFIGKLFGKRGGNKAKTDTVLNHISGLSTGADENSLLEHYAEWDFGTIFSAYFADGEIFDRGNYPHHSVVMPTWSEDKLKDSINNTSQFFYLARIDNDEKLDYNAEVIKIEEDYLQSLVNREAMSDDYLSHDAIKATFSYTYNNRLNLTGLSRRLYRGQSPFSMFQRCHGHIDKTIVFKEEQRTVNTIVNNNMYTGEGFHVGRSSIVPVNKDVDYIMLTPSVPPISSDGTAYIVTYIREDGIEYEVKSKVTSEQFNYISYKKTITHVENGERKEYSETSCNSWGTFLFYPNIGAYRMEVRTMNGTFVVDLKQHDFLNGAYGSLLFATQRKDNQLTKELSDDTRIVDGMTTDIEMPNKIYTSEVNNPFYFPVTGINTVSTGQIYGLASVTKALSEGQFGAFPMYAFTDEGVWAMEVSSSGSYSAKTPVSRDVITNGDSITQLDGAVLFVTARGIMMIEGSKLSCITEDLLGDNIMPVNKLPLYEKLIGLAGLTVEDEPLMKNFKQYLQRCNIIYDYVHQRIIVFATESKSAFVFSLKSKKWGLMTSDFKAVVPSYPEAIAVTHSGEVVDLCEEEEQPKLNNQLVVTRPLKLDAPNDLKTIYTIVQRGMFKKGNVAQVLYGSRDLINWVVIGSSQDHLLQNIAGTPYKYFRLALICKLEKGESLYGCTIEYESRLGNRLR